MARGVKFYPQTSNQNYDLAVRRRICGLRKKRGGVNGPDCRGADQEPSYEKHFHRRHVHHPQKIVGCPENTQ